MGKFTRHNTGATVETTNRTQIEPDWPLGGMVARPLSDRSWSVQQLTGYPSSNVLPGQFTRGQIVRMDQPALSAPEPLPMYDVTDMQRYGSQSYYYRTFS